MTTRLYGAIILILAQIFLLAETIYFGNNWLPQSAAEAICYSAGILWATLGLVMAIVG